MIEENYVIIFRKIFAHTTQKKNDIKNFTIKINKKIYQIKNADILQNFLDTFYKIYITIQFLGDCNFSKTFTPFLIPDII